MTPNINKILSYPCNKGYNQYGANMGRHNYTDGNCEHLHLQKVRIDSGGYDVGGAYWGIGKQLWCAFSGNNTENDVPMMIFVRGHNRDEAKKFVRDSTWNNVSFVR